MKTTTRTKVLAELGHPKPARTSWSHEVGGYIYFDAWTDEYVNLRYPMRTVDE